MFKFLYLKVNEKGFSGHDRLQIIENFARDLQMKPSALMEIQSFFIFDIQNIPLMTNFFVTNPSLVNGEVDKEYQLPAPRIKASAK